MSLNATIFVEGVADGKFILDFLEARWNLKLELGKQIQSVEGKDNLRNYKKRFEISTDLGLTNLLIFDADGNYTKRLSELEKVRADLGIQFETFLFPNNSSNGDLETLLRQIANLPHVFDCIENYAVCINNLNTEHLRQIDSKAYVYIYADSFKSSGSKEKQRDYTNGDIWDLNSDFLSHLFDFINPFVDRNSD